MTQKAAKKNCSKNGPKWPPYPSGRPKMTPKPPEIGPDYVFRLQTFSHHILRLKPENYTEREREIERERV